MTIAGTIVVYSINGCPHCIAAKNSLTKADLPYTDVNVEKYPDLRDWLRKYTGKSSVPQIFFNNKHIGGNEDLQNLVSFLN